MMGTAFFCSGGHIERRLSGVGDMVEAIEIPQLSNKYQVQGVPRTVINEDYHLVGAAPEAMLMAKVQEALAG